MIGYISIFFLGFCLVNAENAVFDASTVPVMCRLPEVKGPCRAAHERYFFDVKTGKCKMFLYGGCEGNKNRFNTMADCEKTCVPGTCSSASCNIYCEYGRKVDAWGCEICECNLPPTTLPPIGLVPCLEMACPNSCPKGYVLDMMGCPTCECIEENKNCPPQAMCQMLCPHGFALNQDGCPRCECADPPVEIGANCPAVQCNLYCPGGSLKKDKNGCQLCECEDSPCHHTECSSEEICVVDRSKETPVARCQPGRRWCDQVICMMHCPNGFATDDFGCDVCRCKNETTSVCPNQPHNCTNTCQFGYAYDTNGCKTCNCLHNGCDGLVCRSDSEVCSVHRYPRCSSCPYIPECVDADLVKRIHVTMVYASKEITTLDSDDFIRELIYVISSKGNVATSYIAKVQAHPINDRSVHVTFHIIGESQLVASYERFAAAVVRGEGIVVVEGVSYLPQADTMTPVYYKTADSWEDVDESPQTIIIIIAVSTAVLLAGLTIVILVVACKKKQKAPKNYPNSIYRPVAVAPGKV